MTTPSTALSRRPDPQYVAGLHLRERHVAFAAIRLYAPRIFGASASRAPELLASAPERAAPAPGEKHQ